jgi:hypothetical protein
MKNVGVKGFSKFHKNVYEWTILNLEFNFYVDFQARVI